MIQPRVSLLALSSLFFAAGLAAQTDTAQKHQLRYAFQKGTKGHFKFIQNADMKMSMAGQPMDTTMSMNMFMEFQVADVVDGQAVIKNKVTRLKMKLDNPMMPMEFDTDDEDSVPAMFDSMLDVIGQTMEMRVDARGKATVVEIPQAIEAAGQRGLNLDKMFDQFMAVLPEQPIAIGETWTTSQKQAVGQMGEIDIVVENKLVAVDGSKVTIEQTMKMKLEGEETPDITIKKAKGRIVLDTAQGMPHTVDLEMIMDMSMDRGGMSMDAEVKTTLKMERTAAPAKKAADNKGDGVD